MFRAVRTVELANQTRFIQVLNLPHDVVPEMSSRGIVGTRDHDPVSGERPVRVHKKCISGSITLMPKGTEGDIVRGLPPSVMQAPDVQRALTMWPPRIAAKTLEKYEWEKAEQERAEAAEKQATADKELEELLKIRNERLAQQAAGMFDTAPEEAPAAAPTDEGDRPTVPIPAALAPELAAAAVSAEEKKTERVARKAPKE